jgi:hypothetical protein
MTVMAVQPKPKGHAPWGGNPSSDRDCTYYLTPEKGCIKGIICDWKHAKNQLKPGCCFKCGMLLSLGHAATCLDGPSPQPYKTIPAKESTPVPKAAPKPTPVKPAQTGMTREDVRSMFKAEVEEKEKTEKAAKAKEKEKQNTQKQARKSEEERWE